MPVELPENPSLAAPAPPAPATGIEKGSTAPDVTKSFGYSGTLELPKSEDMEALIKTAPPAPETPTSAPIPAPEAKTEIKPEVTSDVKPEPPVAPTPQPSPEQEEVSTDDNVLARLEAARRSVPRALDSKPPEEKESGSVEAAPPPPTGGYADPVARRIPIETVSPVAAAPVSPVEHLVPHQGPVDIAITSMSESTVDPTAGEPVHHLVSDEGAGTGGPSLHDAQALEAMHNESHQEAASSLPHIPERALSESPAPQEQRKDGDTAPEVIAADILDNNPAVRALAEDIIHFAESHHMSMDAAKSAMEEHFQGVGSAVIDLLISHRQNQ